MVVERCKGASAQCARACALHRQDLHVGFAGVQDITHPVLRNRKNNIHGHDLRDHGNTIGIAAADSVAYIDCTKANPAADRRSDAGVAQVELCSAHGGIVDHDRALQLLDKRRLGINLLAGNRVLLKQSFKALQRDPGTFKLRCILLALACCLRHSQLKLAGIQCGQQIAFSDHLTFGEKYFFKHARHLWFDLDRGQRRDCAQRIERDGNAGPLCRGHPHSACAARTSAGTTSTRPAGTTAARGCTAGRS